MNEQHYQPEEQFKILMRELEGKLHEDGTYHVTPELIEQICRQLVQLHYSIKLFPDGDQWCALIGKNIHDGSAGFGKTRKEAIINLLSDKTF